MRRPARSDLRNSSLDRANLEREILVRLCRVTLTRAARTKIAAALRGYAWHDAEHALVYAAIERLGTRDSATLRHELPAQATRMGFPDIDWQIYFESVQAKAAPAFAEIAALIAQLPTSRAAKR